MDIKKPNIKNSPHGWMADIYNAIIDMIEQDPDRDDPEEQVFYGHVLDHIINATGQYVDGNRDDIIGALADGVEFDDTEKLMLVHFRAMYIRKYQI